MLHRSATSPSCWTGFSCLVAAAQQNQRARLTHPCQQAALASSSGLLSYLVALLGAVHLYRLRQHKSTLAASGLFMLLAITLAGSNAPATSAVINLDLPGWTSPTAGSNVFVVPNVPVPECSLDGGVLPGAPPRSDANCALRDAGLDQLVDEMEGQEDYIYRTTSHAIGIVGADDFVVIKIRNSGAAWGTATEPAASRPIPICSRASSGAFWNAQTTLPARPSWPKTPRT